MFTILQDLRSALRRIRNNPGFTAAVVASLALGIGANTAVFTLIDAVLLQPVPGVADAGQLVKIFSRSEKERFANSSYANYLDYAQDSPGLSALAAFALFEVSLTHEGPSERLTAVAVSGNYFQVLGVEPALGRFAVFSEESPPAVAVLAHGLWQRRFGADPGVVGKTLTLNGKSVTVAAVAPPGFRGADRVHSPEVWVPIITFKEIAAGPMGAFSDLHDRGQRWLEMVGRRRGGVTLEQARGALEVAARRLEQAYPDANKDRGVSVLPLAEVAFGTGKRQQVVRFSGLLMSVTGAVLLVACLNFSGLLLARGLTRHQEIAIRLSLGAGRRRLVGLLVTEGLLLALLGGATGVGLAVAVLPWLEGLRLPADVALSLGLNGRVLGFALAVSLLAGVASALVPAWKSSRPELVSALKGETPTAGSPRLRNVLVSAQVALALLILIASGLLLRTLSSLRSIDPGFDPEKILVAALDLSPAGYSGVEVVRFYQRLSERLAALPGVERASMAAGLPIVGATLQVDLLVSVEGYEPQGDEPRGVSHALVGAGYFSTVGTSIVGGRDFSPRDTATSPGVVIVNKTMARRYWPGQDPIGRHVGLLNGTEPFEVIGVVADSKYADLRESPKPIVYLYHAQQERWFISAMLAPAMTLVIRTTDKPRAVLPAVRREVQALDPYLPIFAITTLPESLSAAVGIERQVATLFSFFALLAVALTMVGLYGVVSQTVVQRTGEIGLRVALGATPRAVIAAELGRGLMLGFLGIVLGLAAAVPLSQLVASRLYGVSATDPWTYLIAALGLWAVALATAWLPSRNAARIDPAVALRCL